MAKKRKPAKFFCLPGGNDQSRLTKSEIERRKAAEIKIGSREFLVPPNIESNKIAKEKWDHITSLYKNLDHEIVTDADIDLIEQYCIAYSEYCQLVTMRRNVFADCKTKRFSSVDTAKKIKDCGIDSMVNKKSDLLQKLAVKLLLDPVARVNSIPIEPPENPNTDAENSGFAV